MSTKLTEEVGGEIEAEFAITLQQEPGLLPPPSCRRGREEEAPWKKAVLAALAPLTEEVGGEEVRAIMLGRSESTSTGFFETTSSSR